MAEAFLVGKPNTFFKEITSTKSYWRDVSLLDDGWDKNPFKTRKGYPIIESMLLDELVYGILELKKIYLLSTGYQFIVPKESDNEQYKEMLDFVRYNFAENYNRQFIQDLYQILTAHEYGFSLSEMIFEKNKNKQFGEKIWLKRVKTIPPESIGFVTDQYGKLEKIIQRGIPAIGEIELPSWKLLHYTANQRFDNPYGESDLQRCYKSWFLKDITQKFWGIYLQKFASPIPIAKVPDEYGEAKTTELVKILESLQQASAAAVPEGVQIDFVKAVSSSSEFDSAIEKFNQAISRALLIPDLVGFGSTISGGSLALGRKHFELFVSALEFERRLIEDLINERAIKMLIDLNYGEQEIYPQMQFKPYNDESKMEMLNIFLAALEKGMPATEEDFNHFKTLIDFPINKKQNEIVPTKTPDSGSDREKGEDAVEDADEKMIKITRIETKFEKRVDIIEETEEIIKKEDEAINDLARVFGKMKTTLKDTIVRRKIVEENNYSEIGRLQLKYLGEIKTILKNGLDDIYKLGWNRAMREIKSLQKEQKYSANVTDLLVPSSEAKSIAEEIINQRTFQAVGKLKDDILNKAKNLLIAGMEKGESTQNIMENLDDLFNSVVIGSSSAELTAAPNLLETIIRTNYNNFYNTARKQVANTPVIGKFVEMYQFSAILDDRTTDRCKTLDKFIAPKDDPIWDQITPPMHFNCRSYLRYITAVDTAEGNIMPSPKPSLEELKEMGGGDSFI